MPAWNFPPLFIPINVLTLILATHFSGQQEEKISTRGTEDKLDYPTPNGSLFKKNFSIHFFFPPNCSKLASSSLQKLTLSGFKIPTIIERDLDLQRGSSSLARCTWKIHHNDVILALSSLWSTRGEAVVLVQTYHPSSRETEKGGYWIQDQPRLQNIVVRLFPRH